MKHNLCDCCHLAEKACPIWAPSGRVERCAQWTPVTRHELADLRLVQQITADNLSASVKRENELRAEIERLRE